MEFDSFAIKCDPFSNICLFSISGPFVYNSHFIGFEIVPAFHQGALQRLDSECGPEYTEASEAFQPMLFEKAE